jgi:Trehalose utilisation
MNLGIFRASSAFATVMVLCLLGACSSEGELIKRYESASGSSAPRILFLAGRDSHGPLAHEHKDGSLLLASALHKQHPDYSIDVVYGGWPKNSSLLKNIDALVFYCDGGKGHMMVGHLDEFEALLADDVGVVALHYGVEVPKSSAAAALMLRATGGYFETHWSVNPHWTAKFENVPEHPVTAGIGPFEMNDEWYFNMRFQTEPEGVVEPLLMAIPPIETMERSNGPHSGNDVVRKMVAEERPQILAWAYSRPGGGRGMGYTGGHYHANWDEFNATQLVINGIAWSAQGRRE